MDGQPRICCDGNRLAGGIPSSRRGDDGGVWLDPIAPRGYLLRQAGGVGVERVILGLLLGQNALIHQEVHSVLIPVIPAAAGGRGRLGQGSPAQGAADPIQECGDLGVGGRCIGLEGGCGRPVNNLQGVKVCDGLLLGRRAAGDVHKGRAVGILRVLPVVLLPVAGGEGLIDRQHIVHPGGAAGHGLLLHRVVRQRLLVSAQPLLDVLDGGVIVDPECSVFSVDRVQHPDGVEAVDGGGIPFGGVHIRIGHRHRFGIAQAAGGPPDDHRRRRTGHGALGGKRGWSGSAQDLPVIQDADGVELCIAAIPHVGKDGGGAAAGLPGESKGRMPVDLHSQARAGDVALFRLFRDALAALALGPQDNISSLDHRRIALGVAGKPACVEVGAVARQNGDRGFILLPGALQRHADAAAGQAAVCDGFAGGQPHIGGDSVVALRVARDGGRPGDPEVTPVAQHHAAAIGSRVVAGDAAALHVKGAVHDVYAAAPAVAVRTRSIAGDAAAVHGKGAAVDKHTAAVLRHRIIGDGAAIQGYAAAVKDMDAAAGGAVCSDGIPADSRSPADGGAGTTACHIQAGAGVAGNFAAGHGKLATVGHVYHAAAMAGVVVGNCAALHLKGAAIYGDGVAQHPG